MTIESGHDLRDKPGPEAFESFGAWWLASLALRYPGRRFRLVPKDEPDRGARADHDDPEKPA
jgi:hypothetical protein